MVFSSIIFIFQFLPVALLAYYLCPVKYKNIVLMVSSLFFYSWGEPRYFPLMLLTVFINYICAINIERCEDKEYGKRTNLIIAAVSNLGILFIFKYLDFLIENINSLLGWSIPLMGLTLPLGISFYTFQALAYVIDVYRRKFPAERSYIDLCAFIMMFPQLIAGPIVRYGDVRSQMKTTRFFSLRAMEEGTEQFVLGLARKVLLANGIGALFDEVMLLGAPAVSSGLAWLGMLAFSLQIYFDFSGYSQMAIGLGKMLGFDFPQNFNNPYMSLSATEFWRRWHITLGSWFKEYLYIPLGGSRVSYLRTLLNIFIVWSLTGLWHGASWNFLLWGIYFFVLLAIEKAGLLGFLSQHRTIARIYTLTALILGWSLFAITDLPTLAIFLSRMFNPISASAAFSTVDAAYYLRNYFVILAFGIFFSTSYAGEYWRKLREKQAIRVGVLCVLFLLCVAYLVDSTYNPFLYFRF